MYGISFVLPMLEMFGFYAFWIYFKMFFKFDEDQYLSILAINLSNVVMILSPLLIRAINPKVLGVLLLLGGLHNSHFLLEGTPLFYDQIALMAKGAWAARPVDITLFDPFPAFHVWCLSFFLVGFGLWRIPSLRS